MNVEWKAYEAKFKGEVDTAISWMVSEFNKIRAGQATPALVTGAKIEAYGSFVNLPEIANVQVPEPRALVIKPYDPAIINDIIKGLNKFNSDLNPVVDGKIIRIVVPAPTEESRKKSLKIVKEYLEKTKITIRNARKHIQNSIKDAKYAEGLEQLYLENLNKLVKQANDEAEQLYKNKEANLLKL